MGSARTARKRCSKSASKRFPGPSIASRARRKPRKASCSFRFPAFYSSEISGIDSLKGARYAFAGRTLAWRRPEEIAGAMCERRGLALDWAESEAHWRAFRFLRRHETSHFDGCAVFCVTAFEISRQMPPQALALPGTAMVNVRR